MSTQSAPAAPTSGTGKGPGHVSYRWAWLSLLLYPFTFVAAFAVGGGLLSLVAEDQTNPAFWEMLVSATPALLVFVIPGVLSVVLGRRAVGWASRRARCRRSRAPASPSPSWASTCSPAC